METPNPADEAEVVVPEAKPSEGIDVTPEPKAQKPEVKPLDEETKKLHRRMEYQSRQFERAMEELRNIATKIQTSPAPSPAPKEEVDDVDVIAQQDWKKGVKMVVTPEIEKTVKAILDQERQEFARTQQQSATEQIRQKSITTVREAHPEVEDEDSEFSQAYIRVLSEDRNLLSNPLGPELAMARAERLLKNDGRIKTETNVETNSERVARVRSAYVPQGAKPSGEGRIILTAEEKKICDEKGIKYADYTKMRGMTSTNFREGVSADE